MCPCCFCGLVWCSLRLTGCLSSSPHSVNPLLPPLRPTSSSSRLLSAPPSLRPVSFPSRLLSYLLLSYLLSVPAALSSPYLRPVFSFSRLFFPSLLPISSPLLPVRLYYFPYFSHCTRHFFSLPHIFLLTAFSTYRLFYLQPFLLTTLFYLPPFLLTAFSTCRLFYLPQSFTFRPVWSSYLYIYIFI